MLLIYMIVYLFLLTSKSKGSVLYFLVLLIKALSKLSQLSSKILWRDLDPKFDNCPKLLFIPMFLRGASSISNSATQFLCVYFAQISPQVSSCYQCNQIQDPYTCKN